MHRTPLHVTSSSKRYTQHCIIIAYPHCTFNIASSLHILTASQRIAYSTLRHHCISSLHRITLHLITASHHSIALWHVITAPPAPCISSRIVQPHVTSSSERCIHYCTASVHIITAYHHSMPSLHFINVLHHCISPLHASLHIISSSDRCIEHCISSLHTITASHQRILPHHYIAPLNRITTCHRCISSLHALHTITALPHHSLHASHHCTALCLIADVIVASECQWCIHYCTSLLHIGTASHHCR